MPLLFQQGPLCVLKIMHRLDDAQDLRTRFIENVKHHSNINRIWSSHDDPPA
jgi:hypothetical protein